MAKILVIDDDVQIGEQLKEILESNGHDVQYLSSSEEALKIKEDFEIILLDLVMPKVDGLYLLSHFKKTHPNTQILMITAFATIESAVSAMRRGATDYISKPFRSKQIETAIRRAMEEAKFANKIEEKKTVLAQPYDKEVQEVLNTLANPIRHGIVDMMKVNGRAGFGEIRTYLNIEDSPKLSFHLRKLMASGLLEQDRDKKYMLSEKGEKVVESLDQLKLGMR
ncbi:transcriptional regulatory protein ZraR [archaeon BMS3Abin16]|nr:transcriptional regulatory protein ZraR [archaeon BMS3Abin16]HDY74504.1 response regulator [Euryarchaeota archaeon]